MFVPGKPFQPCVMKHSSFLDSNLGYKENEVLSKWSQGLHSQHFIFLITYKWDQQTIAFVPSKPFLPSGM
jgi:hypothetical protein